ncbi:DNA-directed RNA polymerase II subunit 1-like isoform X2 [Asparagus officinalis]|uniref:DNA-directed RNA polymerase II subunit 1-like isoform X2 n=1 Tax=Asparagus officinalis TaxID=4686 RepID=UPI00098DFEA3|nr:DNA-directed RNA polymerase II subunit 1-like isoform X2 [Asparagus officinalis]
MRNEGQRPQGSGRNNGFMRSFSSYLRIVSNYASNVASTVKSAGVSVASSLADRDEDAARDQILSVLKRIINEDSLLLGFIPKDDRPDWMILRLLPIQPPTVIPSVMMDTSARSEVVRTSVV